MRAMSCPFTLPPKCAIRVRLLTMLNGRDGPFIELLPMECEMRASKELAGTMLNTSECDDQVKVTLFASLDVAVCGVMHDIKSLHLIWHSNNLNIMSKERKVGKYM